MASYRGIGEHLQALPAEPRGRSEHSKNSENKWGGFIRIRRFP
jgi:hypothetical protein